MTWEDMVTLFVKLHHDAERSPHAKDLLQGNIDILICDLIDAGCIYAEILRAEREANKKYREELEYEWNILNFPNRK